MDKSKRNYITRLMQFESLMELPKMNTNNSNTQTTEPMTDVMLDFETLDVRPTAVVMQVGACYFNRYSGKLGHYFLRNVDIQSELDQGFTVCGSTIEFWLPQSPEARASILTNPQPSLWVFEELNTFLRNATAVWCHTTFDWGILMHHLTTLKLSPSFGFRVPRDLRTLVYLAQIDYKSYPRIGVEHSALDDCRTQISYTVDAINKLTLGEGQ